MADLKELKDEVVRLNSMANKRIKRMINSDMYSPALGSRIEHLGAFRMYDETNEEFYNKVKFTIDRNASYDEVQKAYWQVKRYLGLKTSSIKGTSEVLNEIAKSTGLEKIYKKYKANSIEKSRINSIFFKLYDKVEQYLQHSKGKAESFNYFEIFSKVSMFLEEDEIIGDVKNNVEVGSIDLENLLDKIINYFKNDNSKDSDLEIDTSDFIDI